MPERLARLLADEPPPGRRSIGLRNVDRRLRALVVAVSIAALIAAASGLIAGESLTGVARAMIGILG